MSLATRRVNNGALDLSPEDVYQLATGHRFFRTAGAPPLDVRQAWQTIGMALTQEHSRLMPRSRPHAWWIYNAPERRRQVEGPTHSMLEIGSRVMQKFFYGRPSTHNGVGDPAAEFECQHEFLERHRLFLPQEATAPCAACTYSGFGEPHLTFAQVRTWYESAYHA
jgi:hypothetical protein